MEKESTIHRINQTFSIRSERLLRRGKDDERLVFHSEDSSQESLAFVAELICFIVLVVCVCAIVYGLRHIDKLNSYKEKDDAKSCISEMSTKSCISEISTKSCISEISTC